MMNISTDSKIYKLLKFFDSFFLTSFVVSKDWDDNWKIHDLCTLIRTLTFGFLFLFFCVLTPCLWVWLLLAQPDESFISFYSAISLIMSTVSLTIVFLALTVIPFLVEKIGQFTIYLKSKRKTTDALDDFVNHTPKPPSTFKVFIQYCVDKHNKVCRSISFKDNTKDD